MASTERFLAISHLLGAALIWQLATIESYGAFLLFSLIYGLVYAPTMHVHYGEKVMSVRDGLPKFADMPAAFGGSGKELPE